MDRRMLEVPRSLLRLLHRSAEVSYNFSCEYYLHHFVTVHAIIVISLVGGTSKAKKKRGFAVIAVLKQKISNVALLPYIPPCPVSFFVHLAFSAINIRETSQKASQLVSYFV